VVIESEWEVLVVELRTVLELQAHPDLRLNSENVVAEVEQELGQGLEAWVQP
jgi:hypothetical protein